MEIHIIPPEARPDVDAAARRVADSLLDLVPDDYLEWAVERACGHVVTDLLATKMPPARCVEWGDSFGVSLRREVKRRTMSGAAR